MSCWRIPAGALLLMLFMVGLPGCGPAGAFSSLFEDDGPGPGPVSSFEFQMPADGSTVNSVMTLSVDEPSIVAAQFVVDGVLVHEADSAPFEWVLDPADFILGERTIRVAAANAEGDSDATTVVIQLERAVPIADIHAAMDSLPITHWYEVPNTRLRAVGWADPDDYRGDLTHIMTAASGGAYDTKRDRLIVYGGASTYGGNEMYAFDVATARWLRLTDPSEFDPIDPTNSLGQPTHPDGAPYSRHTYNYVQYLPPPIDRFYLGGGSSLYADPNLNDDQTYFFDFDTLTWETVAPESPSAGIGSISVVDSDGIVWQQGAYTNRPLASFDPSTKTWTTHRTWTGWYPETTTSTIDPVARKMVAIGAGVTWVWDLNNPDQPAAELDSTGDTEIEGIVRPGIAYHPGTGLFVAWAGGSAIYTLDLSTSTWTRIQSAGSVNPGLQTERGTHGRFRYIASKNLFIVVSSVDTNVFYYRFVED